MSIQSKTSYEIIKGMNLARGLSGSTGEIYDITVEILEKTMASLGKDNPYVIETFVIEGGTGLSNGVGGEGLAMDIIGVMIDDGVSSYVSTMINATGVDNSVLGTRTVAMPNGESRVMERFFSEIYDSIYIAIIREYLEANSSTLDVRKDHRVIVAEPLVLRDFMDIDEKTIDRLVTKQTYVAVNQLKIVNSRASKDENLVFGLGDLTSERGTLLVQFDSKGRVKQSKIHVEISRANSDRLQRTENGILIDPTVVLDTTFHTRNANPGYNKTRSLNTSSSNDIIARMSVTPTVAYTGPGETYLHRGGPAYNSFTPQLIGDNTDSSNYPSIGKTLIGLLSMMELASPNVVYRLYDPASIASLDRYVGINDDDTTITPDYAAKNYYSVFSQIFTPSPLISLRIVHGTTDNSTNNLMLSPANVINETVSEYMRGGGLIDEGYHTKLMSLNPVLNIEPNFLGEHYDKEGKERPLSNLDTLYILNDQNGNKDICDYWLTLLTNTAMADPYVVRAGMEDVFKVVTGNRYTPLDLASIVTFNPAWLLHIAAGFKAFVNVTSNVSSYSMYEAQYGSYISNPEAIASGPVYSGNPFATNNYSDNGMDAMDTHWTYAVNDYWGRG